MASPRKEDKKVPAPIIWSGVLFVVVGLLFLIPIGYGLTRPDEHPHSGPGPADGSLGNFGAVIGVLLLLVFISMVVVGLKRIVDNIRSRSN